MSSLHPRGSEGFPQGSRLEADPEEGDRSLLLPTPPKAGPHKRRALRKCCLRTQAWEQQQCQGGSRWGVAWGLPTSKATRSLVLRPRLELRPPPQKHVVDVETNADLIQGMGTPEKSALWRLGAL